MDSTPGFGKRHPLHPVHPALIFQPAECPLTPYLKNDLLKSPDAGFVGAQYLAGPPPGQGVAAVDAEEIPGEEGGFSPPDSGPYLYDDILVIGGVSGLEGHSYLTQQVLPVSFQPLDLLLD